MVATVALILAKPKGEKIQQMAPPMMPRMLFSSSISASNMKLPSTTPKQEPAQITMEASRMMVPARLMKDQPRSHMDRRTLPTVGRW